MSWSYYAACVSYVWGRSSIFLCLTAFVKSYLALVQKLRPSSRSLTRYLLQSKLYPISLLLKISDFWIWHLNSARYYSRITPQWLNFWVMVRHFCFLLVKEMQNSAPNCISSVDAVLLHCHKQYWYSLHHQSEQNLSQYLLSLLLSLGSLHSYQKMSKSVLNFYWWCYCCDSSSFRCLGIWRRDFVIWSSGAVCAPLSCHSSN